MNQALWSEDLQEVLDAALFEPAQWQVMVLRNSNLPFFFATTAVQHPNHRMNAQLLSNSVIGYTFALL